MRHAILKSLVLILSLISFASLSLAQEDAATQNESVIRQKRSTKSKYFDKFKTINTHLVDSGDHQIQIAGRYSGVNLVAKSSDLAVSTTEIYSSQTNTTGGFQYLYGLNKNISLGADMTYSSGNSESITYTQTTESSSNSSSKGISGLNLRAQLGFDLNSVGIFTDLSYSPRIGTASSNGVTNEENNYPEQAAIQLKNSLVLQSAEIKYGATANYIYYLDGELELVGATSTSLRKISGGHVLTAGAFVEFADFYDLNLRAALARSSQKTYKGTNSAQDTEAPSLDYANVAMALNFKIDSTTSILPEAEYATLLTRRNGFIDYDKVNIYAFALALRKSF